MLFARGRKGDINIQGAFLHMTADAAISAGVVVSAALIIWTGWLWLDPAMSLIICVAILLSTTGLLRDSVGMSMAAAPPDTDVAAVRAFCCSAPASSASTISTSGRSDNRNSDDLPSRHAHRRRRRFPDGLRRSEGAHRIGHSTLQIETHPDNGCALAPDEVV